MRRVFFDTSVFHLIGDAFLTVELAPELRRRVEMSPITGIEVLSHLCLETADKNQVIRQIHGMRNWIDREGATILEWPERIIGEVGFGIGFKDDTPDKIGNGLNSCLLAGTEEQTEALRKPAARLMDLLNHYKETRIRQFQVFLEAYRRNPLTEAEYRSAWVDGLAARVGADSRRYNSDEVIQKLEAYYVFSREKLKSVARDTGYRPENHKNDVIDAEQAIQLYDPERHLITCDHIFEQFSRGASSAKQVHTVTHDQLRRAESVTTLIRELTAEE